MKLKWPSWIVAVIVGLPILLILYDAVRPTPLFISTYGTGFWPANPSAMSSFVMMLAFGLIAGWIITTWIRAKYGYPLEDGVNPAHKEKLREKGLDAALVARDERIAELEERVRVLERIVTDRRSALEEEIERLRA